MSLVGLLASTARRLEPDERVGLARALVRLVAELDPDLPIEMRRWH